MRYFIHEDFPRLLIVANGINHAKSKFEEYYVNLTNFEININEDKFFEVDLKLGAVLGIPYGEEFDNFNKGYYKD